MEKLLNLLEVAIATLLVVVAITVQLSDNYRVTAARTKPAVTVDRAAGLRYYCNGLELAAHLILVAEKEQMAVIYQNTEYEYAVFCREILGVEYLPEEPGFKADSRLQKQLAARQFCLFQQEGKWRVEE
ncbi:hypothetical protein EII17_07230 [Clostridiales bacterium COT073_COT-073]|nr:hypothetical protein EII17_07230 [Clostridiales bacterium COT073_COT-073]